MNNKTDKPLTREKKREKERSQISGLEINEGLPHQILQTLKG